MKMRGRSFAVWMVVALVLSSVGLLIQVGLPTMWPAGAWERFWAHAGSVSMNLSYLAVALLAARWLHAAVKIKPFLAILRFFMRHHVVIGWTLTVLAVAHSVFYLVKLSPEASDTVSGLLALAAMVPLIWAGIVLQKKAKGSKKGWMLHLLSGLVFLILLFVHNSYADAHHEMGVYLRVYGTY